MNKVIDISVIIPLFNEDESLPELHDWIVRVMEEHRYAYEIFFVDDGSKDRSWEVILGLKAKNPHVRAVRFRRNYGKSAALNVGFHECAGEVVITMDADLQDSPDEIPILYQRIKNDGLDLVSGWKKKRYDPISKTIPSKFFNWATRKVSGINNLHDFNCGLKSYRKEVVKSIEVYGEMHRYIPVIARWAGFAKIEEQVVQHRARKYGTTKFGWERFVNGFLDLLSIYFVGKFGKRPMHFFGPLGSLMFLVGSMITVWLIIEKLTHLYAGKVEREIVDQPLFYLSLVMIILGVQFFLAGFLGEMMARNAHDRNHYQIENKL